MTTRPVAVALLVFISPLCGCQQSRNSGTTAPSANAGPEDAIRAAIRARLAHNSNLNPSAFDTEVKSVTLEGDHAQAQVEFHVKNGPGVMQLTYALAKQNGAWSVVESTPLGSNFSHPQPNQAQSAAPNTAPSGDSSIFRTMDNFHTGVTAPAQKLPPGHPPINGASSGNPSQTP
jgi:hypothetical protein